RFDATSGFAGPIRLCSAVDRPRFTASAAAADLAAIDDRREFGHGAARRRGSLSNSGRLAAMAPLSLARPAGKPLGAGLQHVCQICLCAYSDWREDRGYSHDRVTTYAPSRTRSGT